LLILFIAFEKKFLVKGIFNKEFSNDKYNRKLQQQSGIVLIIGLLIIWGYNKQNLFVTQS